MLRGGEFYVLVLFALLGQMVMISAGNFLTIYLGLELMSLALYALVAIRRDHAQSTEAAMKYFVLGALASGFMLYGMSMLYGATGNLDLRNIADAVINNFYARPLPLQERTAPYARARLKSLKVPQPDSLIEPLDPALLAPQPAPGSPPPQ
jgi:NADH-quinone oxidoreductase subunit N